MFKTSIVNLSEPQLSVILHFNLERIAILGVYNYLTYPFI